MKKNLFKCQNCNRESRNDLIEVDACNYQKSSIKGSKKILVCNDCCVLWKKRKEDLEKFLNLKKDKKVLVAGPGTGKTFSFLKYLEKFEKKDKVRIVTFINNLVNDLEREADVEFQKNDKLKIKRENVIISTFHSFCREIVLKHREKFFYFNRLFDLILYDIFKRTDRKGKEQFKKTLNNLSEKDGLFNYFFKAGNYYNAVGDSNIVQALLILIRRKEVDINMLDFKEIIIDEFQDFNRAEYEVVEELLKSDKKVLIAGDDDQSLYIKLKHTKPDFIRKIYRDLTFDKATLRCCNRCTEAITQSIKFFINQAHSKKLLNGRIEKEYECYYPDKYLDCRKYPKIFLYKKNISQTGEKLILDIINSYIEQREINKGKLNFIIINPVNRKSILEKIEGKFKDNDRFNIISKKKKNDIFLEDGYRFLKEDNQSNLGWRIVLHCDNSDYAKKIKGDMQRLIDKNLNLYNELDSNYIKKHLDEVERITNSLSLEEVSEYCENKPNILFTNFMGSKGLTADHVILLNIQDGAIPQKIHKIEDEELFSFIVGISRGRKSLHIVSQHSWGGKSIFVDMLPAYYCQKIK